MCSTGIDKIVKHKNVFIQKFESSTFLIPANKKINNLIVNQMKEPQIMKQLCKYFLFG